MTTDLLGVRQAQVQMRLRITEAVWMDQVIEAARLFGWKLHHDRPAQTGRGWRTAIQGDAGFPDLVLVRGERCLFVELKPERGSLSQNQKGWLDALRGVAGIETYVWRPGMWDEVVTALR
jgi:hypothetical protein